MYRKHPHDELGKKDTDGILYKFYSKCTKAAELGCRQHFRETVGRNSSSIDNSTQTMGVDTIKFGKMADLKCWYCSTLEQANNLETAYLFALVG